ncbi:hypothetical protein [Streptomyces sp. NPDC023327]|uniref:hypothetical protein n=1 Tax=Streptomyces sp. NPDC023327 TaxID=3157088 RepID=UPI0033F6D75A
MIMYISAQRLLRSEGVGHGLRELVDRPRHAPGHRDPDPRLGIAVVIGIRLAG